MRVEAERGGIVEIKCGCGVKFCVPLIYVASNPLVRCPKCGESQRWEDVEKFAEEIKEQK